MLTHGDIELHPGPPAFFKFMHWNLNSIPAHDFERVSLLQAFATQEKLNLMAITESALKSKISDDKIEIEGFSTLRNDLSNNDRCGGVLLYYKNDLSVKNRTDLCQMSNTIVAEFSISKKKIFVVVSYRKPSQSAQDFTSYCEQLDNIIEKINLEKPFMTILTGDYNAKHNSWCAGDTTDKFGSAIFDIFAKHAITQTVDQPTNITSRTQHCIDLVATDQPNMIIKNEIVPSLHTYCSHQVNLVKLNFQCLPLPPFNRLVWHYARANLAGLQQSATQFDWDSSLDLRSPSPEDQVNFFDDTIMNIASNFIPNNEQNFYTRRPSLALCKLQKTLQKISQKIHTLCQKRVQNF